MKYQFRTLVAAILVMFVSGQNAQAGISIGADFIMPTSDLGDLAGGGIGLNIGYLHPLTNRTLFLGGIGFNGYGGVSNTVPGIGTEEIQWYGLPVIIGARYMATQQFFLQGRGGIIYKTGEYKDFVGSKEDVSNTDWLLSPGAGVKFGKLGILAEYNISKNSWQWFGLGAFYQFGKQ